MIFAKVFVDNCSSLGQTGGGPAATYFILLRQNKVGKQKATADLPYG